jgi:hypothetical protein
MSMMERNGKGERIMEINHAIDLSIVINREYELKVVELFDPGPGNYGTRTRAAAGSVIRIIFFRFFLRGMAGDP